MCNACGKDGKPLERKPVAVTAPVGVRRLAAQHTMTDISDEKLAEFFQYESWTILSEMATGVSVHFEDARHFSSHWAAGRTIPQFSYGFRVHLLVGALAALYTPPVWQDHEWFRNGLDRWAEHLPKVSKEFDGLLSYYQTPEHRAAGRRSAIKPGKYLRKYFADALTETEIQKYALEWSTTYSPAELHVTQDADTIEAVYVNGPNSCMAGNHFDVHPSRVYAGPDLGVAYIGTPEDAAGRAIVWPDKKIHGRVYGDFERMEDALARAGYVAGGRREFDGARIHKVKAGGHYAMPYLDTHSRVREEDKYFVLDNDGDVASQETHGLAGTQYYCNCGACGAGLRNDETYYIEDMGDYCASCYRDRTTRCDITGSRYRDDNFVAAPPGYDISRAATEDESDKLFYCVGTKMWYPVRDYASVEVDGDIYEAEHAETIAFQCAFTKQWCLNEDRLVTDCGREVSRIAAEDEPEAFAEWLASQDAVIYGTGSALVTADELAA